MKTIFRCGVFRSSFITIVVLLIACSSSPLRSQLQYEEATLPRILQSMTIDELGTLLNQGIYAIGVAETTWNDALGRMWGQNSLYYLRMDSLKGAIDTQLVADPGFIYISDYMGYYEGSKTEFNFQSAQTDNSLLLFYQKQNIDMADWGPLPLEKPIVRAVNISNIDGHVYALFTDSSAAEPRVAVVHSGGAYFLWESVVPTWQFGQDYNYYFSALYYRYRNALGVVSARQYIDSGYYAQVRIDANDTVHIIYFSGQSSTADSFTLKYVKGYGGEFQAPRVLRSGMRIKSGYRSNAGTTVSFSVSDDGKAAHIGWTDLALTHSSQGIYSMLVTDDSVHMDSLISSNIYDEAMFACRKADGAVFAAWPVYGEPVSDLRYSSNLHAPLFSSVKAFPVNVQRPFGLFLDPIVGDLPSYVAAVNRSGIRYLDNLEGNTDTSFIAIPSLLQLSTEVTVDAAGKIYAVYLDTSGSYKLVRIFDKANGVDNAKHLHAADFRLSQNYPNPFNPSTKIEYNLPQQLQVRLTIFNIFGQEVANLFNGIQEPGSKTITWNAGGVASGVYFYRLDAISLAEPGKSFRDVKKMVVVK
jgi:hypothetical protein